jgi:TetR/AcrR family tetracycline transcriptional repressor
MTLLDREGLDGVNMRAVADRLGVQASALYWHLGDKSELLALMAGRLYEAAFEAAPQSDGWRSWLNGFGRAFRKTLLSHRDSARLCAIAKPIDGRVELIAEMTAKPLCSLGLDQRTALCYQSSVISLTLGWVIYEQSAALHDFLERMLDFERSYAIGLTALMDGFPEPARASQFTGGGRKDRPSRPGDESSAAHQRSAVRRRHLKI